MIRTRYSVFGIAAVAAFFFTAACTHQMLTAEESLPAKHPVEVKGKHVTCTECHDAGDLIKGIQKPYALFNHSPLYYKDHSYYAYIGNNGELCSRCHVTSFCLDCHATRPAVEPSLRHGDNPELEFSHRGDYLSRHRIDGEIDPASCYKCHGRSNNALCRNCHRP